MDKLVLQRYFFIGLLLLVSVLVLFILRPFLEVLVFSTIFGVVLSPLYRKISNFLGKREGLGALIVIILFTFIVIVPFVFLVLRLLNESKDVYFQLTNHSNIDYIQKITDFLEKPIQKFYPNFTLNIDGLAGSGANWITSNISAILSSVLAVVTRIILIFVSLFFFLRDGTKFKKILIGLSPLSDDYDEQIFLKLKNTITSTVRGVLLVSVLQGILVGLGLWIFGIPHFTLWGSISAVASVVPGGTSIVYLPAIIYMYVTGNTAYAVGLLLWWGVIIGLVDNILSPYLYSRGAEIHPLIMLFSVLGGLAFFGPIGFIFGPIVLSLFFALIDIYQKIILEKRSL